MSFREGGGFTCNGCHAPTDDFPVTVLRPDVEGEHYHQACWLTGWYTGIPMKGEFPEPEKGPISDIPSERMSHNESDPVNHPAHYNWLPKGIEVIDITEALNFCLGNVLKYVLRADHKGKPLEDLKKARWYIDREITRREAQACASQ